MICKDELKSEFSLSKPALKDKIDNTFMGFSETELDHLIASKLIDSTIIDGELMFYNRAIDSVLESIPQIRCKLKKNNVKRNYLIDENLEYHIQYWSRKSAHNTKMISNIDVTYTAEPINYQEYSAYSFYLPAPIVSNRQRCLLSLFSCKPTYVAPHYHRKRTAYWSEETHPKKVFSRYSLLSFSEMVNLVDCHTIIDNSNAFKEKPLICFSKRVIKLYRELSNNCLKPYSYIKQVYDYITTNYKYSFVRNYKTIDSIVDLCIERQAGDCGSLAMLMVSLLRLFGIKSRVVGGMQIQINLDGSYKNYTHDWVEIYTIEKEWIPIDPFMGVVAHMFKDEASRLFYLGNIDPLRIITCNNGMISFEPKEPSVCDDPFDNQVGEIFCNNICLDYHSVNRGLIINNIDFAFEN